jgi:hypothetical protein
MKSFSLFFILIFLSGCASTNQKNAAAFVRALKDLRLEASDVTQSTITPFYNHSESIAGLKKNGENVSIENLKASFNIPLPVFNIPLLQWNFSASAILAAKNDDALTKLIGPKPVEGSK